LEENNVFFLSEIVIVILFVNMFKQFEFFFWVFFFLNV